MSEYSVEEVMAASASVNAAWCKSDPLVRAPRCHKAAEMLRDYAERIEADERAVPVIVRWRKQPCGWQYKGSSEINPAAAAVLFQHGWEREELFTHPPAQAAQVDAAPIPMVLHCPSCRMQHIDAPETHHVDRALDEAGMDNSYSASWDNPPHRSHLCHGCGTIWRPADVPTIGVTATKTHGKADTFKPAAEGVPEGWRQALERALPFLDDEAGKYEDDGNNEPLDVADTIRDLLAAPSPGESA